MPLDPKAIARWRYDLIFEALGKDLAREVRAEIVRRIARTPVQWPTGERQTKQPAVATIYRWIRAYHKRGLAGLQPTPRSDRGKPRARLPESVVQKAIDYLSRDEGLTFSLLIPLLETEPEVQRKAIHIARSTLQRRLAADAGYTRLKRARARARRRRRFVAKEPHEIWHCDAKGPIELRLTSGAVVSFHVLTILDDATRAVLAVVIAPTPDLAAAVRVFRLAVARWGLPARIYLDRASIFDSHAFREGLAELGAHRIWTKPRNPQAHGKIEAYHRSLGSLFAKRLHAQEVVDLVHAEQLLVAVLEHVYMRRKNRDLGCPPAEALAGRTSSRTVSAARLEDAFREERWLKPNRVTGEVDLPTGKFAVPDHLRGARRRLCFRLDTDPEIVPVVVEPGTDRHLPLERLPVRSQDVADSAPPRERRGEGALQRIYDAYRGQQRPSAEPGFGLPEVFTLLGQATGRPVPRTESEAALVQRTWRRIGPLPRRATETALRVIARDLGPGRAIATYLEALARRVEKSAAKGHSRRKP
jgi:transposase InsO family protein